MNRNELLKAISEEAEIEGMEIIEETNSHVIVYDLKDGREVHFRTSAISEKDILDISRFENSATGETYLQEMAQALIKLPPEFFDTLRHILVVETQEGAQKLCEELDLDYEMWPDTIYFDSEFPSEYLGCVWFHESSVIINMFAIRNACEEIWSGFDESFVSSEMEVGFWTTLLHELRHQMLDCNPFLSEDDYPVYLASEENVENFARETYEAFCAKGWL